MRLPGFTAATVLHNARAGDYSEHLAWVPCEESVVPAQCSLARWTQVLSGWTDAWCEKRGDCRCATVYISNACVLKAQSRSVRDCRREYNCRETCGPTRYEYRYVQQHLNCQCDRWINQPSLGRHAARPSRGTSGGHLCTRRCHRRCPRFVINNSVRSTSVTVKRSNHDGHPTPNRSRSFI